MWLLDIRDEERGMVACFRETQDHGSCWEMVNISKCPDGRQATTVMLPETHRSSTVESDEKEIYKIIMCFAMFLISLLIFYRAKSILGHLLPII